MSLDWFRSWHGAPTDLKWLVIAKRANCSPGVVSAVVWALLDHASQAEDRGTVSNFNCETYAAFSGFEEDQVRAIYAAMEEKEIIVAGKIAQWEKRQPKREDSSTGRTQKYRKKVEDQPALALESDTPQVEEPPPTRAADISAPESKPEPQQLITQEAFALADELAVAVGHDLKFVPPAWCSAASRVQTWLNAGWQHDVIRQSIKSQMQRKRDGPPDRIQYFEKGIAREIAERSTPLPNVVPFSADTIQARYGKTQSPLMAAADRLIADLEGGDGPSREGAVGMLPRGR